ncbi:MAG TPA: hypothetical protein VEO95_05695, partial [Chthoniobacteraceae bacterium]|nr:hypothetical protein [Chthoniobacteraceae bacterium]
MNLPSAFELGRSAGSFIVIGGIVLVAAAAIVWNVLAMRHTSTNPKCALAVIFAVGAGVALAIGGALTQFPDVSSSIRALPGFAALLLLIVAVALAINGLGEFKRFPEHFVHGRKRAIAVLAVPFFVAALIVLAVCLHSSGHPIFGAQISGTASEILTNKEWNFQVIAPPPWVATDGAKFNPRACAGLARTGPQMSSFVIAEDLAQGGVTRLDAAVEAAKAKIKSGSGAEILDEQEQNENGLTGHRIEYIAAIDGKPLYHTHWLTNHGTIFYQLVTAGPRESREQVRTEGRKLAAGFRLIDPSIN